MNQPDHLMRISCTYNDEGTVRPLAQDRVVYITPEGTAGVEYALWVRRLFPGNRVDSTQMTPRFRLEECRPLPVDGRAIPYCSEPLPDRSKSLPDRSKSLPDRSKSLPDRSKRLPNKAPCYVAPPEAFSLYDWQQEALAAWQRAHHRGVVEAITGTGKTRLGLAAIQLAARDHRESVVIVPTRELQSQWAKEIRNWLPTLTVLTKQKTRRWDVLVTTVQSAMRRPLLERTPGRGLLIADECHHCGAERFSEALRDEYSWRLGLTATLQRGDAGDGKLRKYFRGTCYSMGYERAVADSLISPYKFAFVAVPLTPAERGEYNTLSEELRRHRRDLIGIFDVPEEPFPEFIAAVKELADRRYPAAIGYMGCFTKRKQLLAGARSKSDALGYLLEAVRASARTIIFTQTQEVSKGAVELLERAGCSAGAVHCALDGGEREKVMEQFREGSLAAIAAPRVLDEGVDVPAADLGIILAANRSRRQTVQRLGRVLRKQEGKIARFAVVYAEDTVEDPFGFGELPDYYKEIREFSMAQCVFRPSRSAEERHRMIDFLQPASQPPEAVQPGSSVRPD